MSVWTIQGMHRLQGETGVQGAKNAVLPILAGSLLCCGQTHLRNCPDLLDVSASVDILEHLGCQVQRQGPEIIIDARDISHTEIPRRLMMRMRSSVMFMGAILARTGRVQLSTPGGCELGARPIDLHLEALRAMGADIQQAGGEIVCTASKLHGAAINLDFPSVGCTENVMLAACAADGETVLTNAAREPEIVDLQRYLQALGVDISGAGTPCIRIVGQPNMRDLRDTITHTVMPDRIVACTILCAVAAAGGDVLLHGVVPEHLSTVTATLREMGCGIILGRESVRIRCDGAIQAPRPIITKPYPGFPTDAQALCMAACLKATGTSVFVENLFENRFRHVPELRRLGAEIRTEGRVAMVCGVSKLQGALLTATDLRGAAAMLIAALGAEGTTQVLDEGHLRRGYDHFDAVLRSLGAEIREEPEIY